MLLLITGSSGLIGSECVTYFDALSWEVIGIDNNMRLSFFGSDGDTTWVMDRLIQTKRNFKHLSINVRDRKRIMELFDEIRPDAIIHAAAQPSHDLAAEIPFTDFEVNAVGTLNMLEAVRKFYPESPFCHLSTNKVYGDAPNKIPLVELETRYDYALPADYHGVTEELRIDQSMHSLFGASKLAADILVQEYGRYFRMKTVCFRGGCLTGSAHSPAELHGFLAYIFKVMKSGRKYSIFGYKGKQVRDNLHAYDVCRAIEMFIKAPRIGEVYNLGGGRSNSISVLEALEKAQEVTGISIHWEYVDQNRKGDHICYISNTNKLKEHYPTWSITKSLDYIINDLADNMYS